MLRRSRSRRKARATEPEPSGSAALVACHDPDERELIARVVATAVPAVEQADGPTGVERALEAAKPVALVAMLPTEQVTALLGDLRDHEDPARSGLPVLIITDDDRAARAAAAAGADGTLTRPFHADELTGELGAILARSPEERAELRAAPGHGADD